MLYGHGRHENEDFAYDFWSYPYLKRGGRRQDRATRFAIVVKCALRGSRRSPFSILQFRRDCLAIFARKLWMTVWVRFWKKPAKRAYTNSKSLCSLVQAPQTTTWEKREFFVRRDLNWKRWEGSKDEEEFVRRRNLRQVSKIAKGVRRQIWRIFRLRNMCCQKWQHEKSEKYFRLPFLKRKKEWIVMNLKMR